MLDSILEHGLYVGVTLTLFVCGIGLPLPEEGVFLAAGWYGAKNDANLPMLCFCGILGILMGDSIPYWMGRKFGIKLLKRPPLSWFIKEKMLLKTREFFRSHGSKTVFVGRFIAGLRMPAFFLSGSMHVPYWQFLIWDFAGALISCPTSIWLAFKYGHHAEQLLKESRPFLFTVLGSIVLYVGYRIWATKKEKPVDPEAELSNSGAIILPKRGESVPAIGKDDKIPESPAPGRTDKPVKVTMQKDVALGNGE